MLAKIHSIFNSLVGEEEAISKINLVLPFGGLSFSSCVPRTAGWQNSSLRSSPELSVKIRWDESRLKYPALWLNNRFKTVFPLNLSLPLSLVEFTSANVIQKLSSSKEKFIILK